MIPEALIETLDTPALLASGNLTIHGLWIGNNLSPVELLCMRSFMAHGHEFHLWAYDQLETPLPEGAILEDADKIITRDKVFCYKHSNQFGHGKGSYAGFSDIFRYKLLYEHGGWWTDMDVICLKPLDFEEPYVFRTHHEFPAVGNIMKCPPRSVLMAKCYELAYAQVNEENRDWNLPIRILNEQIRENDLIHYIKEFTNHDSWLFVRSILYRRKKIPAHWYALHLVNEEWRRNGINKNAIPKRSLMAELLRQHGLFRQASFGARLHNMSRLIIIRFSLKQAPSLLNKWFWKAVRLVKKEKVRKQ